MSDTYSESEDYLGVTITLQIDEDAQDPRVEMDNLGTMAFEHGRYTLGDKNGTSDLTDAIRKSRYYRDGWEDDNVSRARYYKGDASTPEGISKMLPLCKDIVALPVYMYDHGGLSFSTGRFSCPWDSGQIGFIFMTKETVLSNWPTTNGALTKQAVAKAEEALRIEVDVYYQYKNGDIWGYVIDKYDDSCWGFYGKEAALEAAKEIVQHREGIGEATLPIVP